jgi:hypothetical protein
MSGAHAALLAGLFVVPGLLVWLGHGLRRRPERGRRAFWGAVAGHSAGMALALAAALYPPVVWTAGAGWRGPVVHWAMLLGALLGAGVGALTTRRTR